VHVNFNIHHYAMSGLSLKRRSFVFSLCFSLFSPNLAAKPQNYLEQIAIFWQTLYPSGGTDLYCGKRFGKYDRGYNIEHVMPMAWVKKELKCGTRKQCRERSVRFNQIEMDMHNLYPSDKGANHERLAYAYAEIPGEKWWREDCDLEIDKRKRIAEPREAVRGDIARAALYMEERWGIPIYQRQRSLLLRWHQEDPPDAHERWRNDQIEAYQGNRNPWIDGQRP
jgi:deoxyribonuclease-1